MSDFGLAVEKTLKHEGGYNVIEGDQGGETNFGISKRSYPNVDIKHLTKAQASEIYKRDFWNKSGADKITNQKIAESLFDAAVNMGVSRASKLAKAAAKVPICDGVIGKDSALSINLMNQEDFLTKFTLEKIKFYAAICNKDKSQSKFLLGWINRSLS